MWIFFCLCCIQLNMYDTVATTMNEQCALPTATPDESPGNNVAGWRFGAYQSSRLEINIGEEALKDTFKIE